MCACMCVKGVCGGVGWGGEGGLWGVGLWGVG